MTSMLSVGDSRETPHPYKPLTHRKNTLRCNGIALNPTYRIRTSLKGTR
jgi:hypothetical protein